MRRRLIAAILTFALVFSMIPIIAVAEDCPITAFTMKDEKVIQYSNGYYVYGTNGSWWYKYNTASFGIEINTVTSVDDKAIIQADLDTGKTRTVTYEDEYFFPYMTLEQSSSNQLALGKTAVPVQLSNGEQTKSVEGTMNIDLTASDADKISNVEIPDVIEVEEKNLDIDWFPDDHINFKFSPSFTVKYNDGSVGYGKGNEYHDGKNDIDYAVGIYVEGMEQLDYSNSSLTEITGSDWSVGSLHNAKLTLMGKSYDFKIKVVENKIKKIDVKDTVSVLNGADSYEIIQAIIYADVDIEVTYGDDTKETLKYSDLDEFGIFVDDEDYYITYNDLQDQITINYKDSEIKSIDIDETSVGKIYWGKHFAVSGVEAYQYDPSGTKVVITFTDSTTKTIIYDYYFTENNTFVYNGVKYDLMMETSDIDTDGVDGTLTARIGSISDSVTVEKAAKTITVKGVELVEEPTVKYYLNDYFYECAITNYNGVFEPIEFTGLLLKVTMTDDEVFYIDGDDFIKREDTGMTKFCGSSFASHHCATMVFKNQTETSADLWIKLFGEDYDIGYTFEKVESPYKSITIVECPSATKLASFDATGMKIKIDYKDGSSSTVTLKNPIESPYNDYRFGMSFYNVLKGWGNEPFGYDETKPGVRMNAYYLGNGEYASIIWNNGMLRICDQMISIDPDKYTNVKGTANIDIDTAMLSNAVINSLDEDSAFAVAQQGEILQNTINVDEVEPSDKITVKANKDNSEIVSCFDINFSYLLQGTEYQLTELDNGKIAVTILLDESLWGADKEDIVLYREHKYSDGTKVEQITDFTISDDGKYITFESDKFSTFAIGFSEETSSKSKDDEEIVQTSDNTPIAATVMLLWSSGLCTYAVTKRRKLERDR